MEAKKTEKEKMVKVRLPRMKDKEESVFVSVNEKTWMIKRGVDVEVPECVAEVLEESEKRQEIAYEYEAEVQR